MSQISIAGFASGLHFYIDRSVRSRPNIYMRAYRNLLICLVCLLSFSTYGMLRRSPSTMPATAASRLAAEEANRHPTLSPVFRQRRLSSISTSKETFPLAGNPNIMVVTYLTLNTNDEERTYDTLVIDRNETDLKNRQLFRLTTFGHIDSEVAHQAAEDWCNKMFPTMAYRLLESPPSMPRQITVMRADGSMLGLVDDEPEIAQRYRVFVEIDEQDEDHLRVPPNTRPPDEKADDDFT